MPAAKPVGVAASTMALTSLLSDIVAFDSIEMYSNFKTKFNLFLLRPCHIMWHSKDRVEVVPYQPDTENGSGRDLVNVNFLHVNMMTCVSI